ncbi:hypothetical protein AGMMS4957_10160 [Bacteroidia bacterium]|nr:hypothetical protein AGMMS4957_10160 [Bacteroidia bacterium]
MNLQKISVEAEDAHWFRKNFPCVVPGHRVFLPGQFNLQEITADEVFSAIKKYATKEDASDDSELRAWRKINKFAKNTTLKSGYFWGSSFLNIMIDRNKNTTEYVDGKAQDDFTKKPNDLDYHIHPKNIKQTLENEKESFDGQRDNYREIFSVVTCNSNQPPICPKCKGSGFCRCDFCEGSGREEYVDGNFPNGKKRIKTGQCSNCYGQGKIQCNECGGTGKIVIHSDNYQIIKRFEDKKYILQYDCISSEWESQTWVQGENLHGLGSYNHSKRHGFWYDINNVELESFINKLYKNQNEIIVDNADQSVQTILSKIGENYRVLYERNKKAAYQEWGKKFQTEQVGCALERHIVIPVARISFTHTLYDKDREHDCSIYIMAGEEEDKRGKMTQGLDCWIEDSLDLSWFKSLFV